LVLRLRIPGPGFWKDAKCGGKVNLPFKHPNFTDPFFDAEEEALEFCNGNTVCPLREQCLLFALTNNEKSGVWGGTTEIDRKAIRKKWPLKSGKEPRPEWEWFPPGEPASWYGPAALRAELDQEIEETDEDDDD
jgi:hypothetical protein